MKNVRRLFSAAILHLIPCLPSSAQVPAFVTDSLDSYVTQGLRDWSIPGLAVVVVKNGRVVVMKGYGVRDLEEKKPVDSNTLFMIASNTKLFTGTVLALLDYEHRISLDDRVTKYFPDFKLYNQETTKLVTVRDLLSHRIGTKTFQGDFTFWNSRLTSKEIMYRMRLLKPVGAFRKDFGYCNSCFMTAGQIVPLVTGQPWNEYVQDSLLDLLQMDRSTTISAGMELKENVARPYTNNFTDHLERVPFDQWDNLAPAASIISNIHDLSHWLLFQLDSGRYGGRQVLPFAVLQKTRDVNIILSSRKSSVFPTHFTGYGLGLFVSDYNGRQVYYHTGGAGGMVSNVCFVPEENLGIAILTNNDNQYFFEALRYQLLDAFLGVPTVNRSLQALPRFTSERKEMLEQITEWEKRVNKNTPRLSLVSYAGLYENPLYGPVQITADGDHLSVIFPGHKHLTATLKYMDHGEWLLRYNNILYGIFKVTFKENDKRVISIDLQVSDFVEYDPYTFEKKQ